MNIPQLNPYTFLEKSGVELEFKYPNSTCAVYKGKINDDYCIVKVGFVGVGYDILGNLVKLNSSEQVKREVAFLEGTKLNENTPDLFLSKIFPNTNLLFGLPQQFREPALLVKEFVEGDVFQSSEYVVSDRAFREVKQFIKSQHSNGYANFDLGKKDNYLVDGDRIKLFDFGNVMHRSQFGSDLSFQNKKKEDLVNLENMLF